MDPKNEIKDKVASDAFVIAVFTAMQTKATDVSSNNIRQKAYDVIRFVKKQHGLCANYGTMFGDSCLGTDGTSPARISLEKAFNARGVLPVTVVIEWHSSTYMYLAVQVSKLFVGGRKRFRNNTTMLKVFFFLLAGIPRHIARSVEKGVFCFALRTLNSALSNTLSTLYASLDK